MILRKWDVSPWFKDTNICMNTHRNIIWFTKTSCYEQTIHIEQLLSTQQQKCWSPLLVLRFVSWIPFSTSPASHFFQRMFGILTEVQDLLLEEVNQGPAGSIGSYFPVLWWVNPSLRPSCCNTQSLFLQTHSEEAQMHLSGRWPCVHSNDRCQWERKDTVFSSLGWAQQSVEETRLLTPESSPSVN